MTGPNTELIMANDWFLEVDQCLHIPTHSVVILETLCCITASQSIVWKLFKVAHRANGQVWGELD